MRLKTREKEAKQTSQNLSLRQTKWAKLGKKPRLSMHMPLLRRERAEAQEARSDPYASAGACHEDINSSSLLVKGEERDISSQTRPEREVA